MTYQAYVKAKTTRGLIKEYKFLYETIEVFGCFSTKDLALFEEIDTELQKRKYDVEALYLKLEDKADALYEKVRKKGD